MAKIAEKSPVTKSRQTKLSKKSTEELIQIILKKDKTEKSLSTQVINLKAEVNSLTKRITNYEKDMEGTIKSLNDKHAEDLKVLSDRADKTYKDLLDAELKNNNASKDNVELNDKIKSFKTLSIILAIYSIAVTLYCLFC
jgi:seryl-tRNA synthetase